LLQQQNIEASQRSNAPREVSSEAVVEQAELSETSQLHNVSVDFSFQTILAEIQELKLCQRVQLDWNLSAQEVAFQIQCCQILCVSDAWGDEAS
jgi:hypothetical protein